MKVWLVCSPGMALPGTDLGKSWFPGLRRVEYIDYDGVCRTTSAWKGALSPRD